MIDDAQGLRVRIERDLREAMKQRDEDTTRTLRSLLGTLDNATAIQPTAEHPTNFSRSAEVPRRVLSLAETQTLIRNEAEERHRSAAQYAQLDKQAEAARLRAEFAVTSRYLGAKSE